MKWIRSFIIAFSMYSKIPMPRVEWTTSSMQYAFCFFPLVGAVAGALTWGTGLVLFGLRDAGKLPALFPAVFLTILPLLVTGGIHMDGFMDTSDARHSYGEREKKLAILKDPHTGAFAVMSVAIYLLWSLALWSAADEKVLPGMACAMVLSRTLSGLSVTVGKGAKSDGLATAFRESARQKAVWISTGIYLAAGVIFLVAVSGVIPAVLLLFTAGAVFARYLRMAVREFGGITGDLAGWFLQVFELTVLTVLTAWSWMIRF